MPNSDVFTGLQYMHTMLYQRMNDAYLGRWPSGQISHAILNHAKNVSDDIAVVQYAERPHMTGSFQVMCLSTIVYTQMAYQKETPMRVWRHNLHS